VDLQSYEKTADFLAALSIVHQRAKPLQESLVIITIVIMDHVPIDDYVLDVLLPDLAGHDHTPAAFLVYLVLWAQLYRSEQRRIGVSLQRLSELAGLSKSAVQGALRLLKLRGLVRVSKTSPTAVPQYELIRHWLRRRARNAATR
jgi:hypothetical protein